jgi:biopolymer transport protein ExbD
VSSPLNDIMFFLLLFFLIVSTLASPKVIKVLLPKAEAAQSASKKPVTVTVTADKRYYIDNEEIPFESLEKKLQSSVGEEATVVIRPSRELSVQDLVDVLQIGAKNNFRMVLATTRK